MLYCIMCLYLDTALSYCLSLHLSGVHEAIVRPAPRARRAPGAHVLQRLGRRGTVRAYPYVCVYTYTYIYIYTHTHTGELGTCCAGADCAG